MTKRTLLEPVNFQRQTLEELFILELEVAASFGNLIENREPGGRPLPSSIWMEFGNLNRPAGVEGQEGCTTIYVIAKTGMWAAHFWEQTLSEIIFNDIGEAIDVRDWPDEYLQSGVLDFIRYGDGPSKQSSPYLGTS